MSTKLSNTDHYDATPEQILAMLQDPEYAASKYADLGDVKFEVTNHSPSDGGLQVTVERTVAANLPDLAKKVMGETTNMTQTESWTSSGDSITGEMTIKSSAPVAISVKNTIKAAGGGSDWTSDFDIKASVPLIGGKVEKMVAEETKSSLVKEKAFNDSWLASH